MKTFYQFLQTYRQPKEIDALTKFANDAFNDHSFPKQSADYHEISSYLEMNGSYLASMSIFDDAWEKYSQQNLSS
ncbi:YozE family protein [Bacillus sp. 1P06AnD]|uniref:YozE family protein n=1 Tax=Bacillus sp. 1P06AnD TaxID=3132208 RepID=UPI0039A15765